MGFARAIFPTRILSSSLFPWPRSFLGAFAGLRQGGGIRLIGRGRSQINNAVESQNTQTQESHEYEDPNA